MKKILFVDDEPMVLRGLERSLRGMRHEWQLEFAEGGPQALEKMAHGDFDVVISDLRMPGMDGAQLLREVKSRFPETVRMALSGQSDEATGLRAVRTAHQYLSKPCEAEEIKSKLRGVLGLRDLLDNPALKQVISRLESVPSQPSSYAAVHKLLGSSGASLTEAADLVAGDLGMSAKVLQLANSAFFSAAVPTASARKAVSRLGLNHLTALVMSADAFSETAGPPTAEMTHIWTESLQTATLAQALAQAEGCNETTTDSAFTAGLLHDLGKLLLAAEFKQEYQVALDETHTRKMPLEEIEQERFLCTHGQAGGYLLGLWGLPQAIVEAVAWHHLPSRIRPDGFCPLVAVHVADALLGRQRAPQDRDGLDLDWLETIGMMPRLPVWATICERTFKAGVQS